MRTNYFTSVTGFQGNTNSDNGYAKATVTEDRGYWTSGGGGGGLVDLFIVQIPPDALRW